MSSTTTRPVVPVDAQICHSDALEYWTGISANVSGMLGEFPHISRIDLRGSASFLAKLRKTSARQLAASSGSMLARAVDCGAGIGRVTAGLLSKTCTVIDIVEPIAAFASEVVNQSMAGSGKIGEVYVVGLEKWEPQEKYDLIWCQWCLGHLTDAELLRYFERCMSALCDGGWIVIKENMSTNPGGQDVFDALDSSVTRTDTKFRTLIDRSGLAIVRTELQAGFPKELYPVRFYALQPQPSPKLPRQDQSAVQSKDNPCV